MPNDHPATAHSATALPFRADLQGLRAVAVLVVCLAHAGVPALAGGFVGVDVFFVLSGALITGLLLRELEQSGRIDFIGFYARRVKRLLPAMLTMLAVSFAAAAALLSDTEASAQLASAPYAATWVSNLYFAFAKFGYFDELAALDLFIHTWSLAVEEQFYLVWPLLLTLLPWRSPSGTARGLAILGVAGLAASLYWTYERPEFGFYLMPSRSWQFALGGLAYLAASRPDLRRALTPPRAALACGLGLGLILASTALLHPRLAYPGAWALLPSLGAALLIACGSALGARHPLAHPALVWLGDRSYALYLWHWPVLVLGFALGYEGQPGPTAILGLLALQLALVSYRCVELPFWKGRASYGPARRTLLLGVLAVVVTLAGGLTGLRALEPPPSGAADAASAWRGDAPVIYRQHCDAWYSHARVEPCVFGPETAKRTAVLLGDSISAQWFSLVQGIFAPPQWRVVVLTKSSCPMLDIDFFYERIGQTYQVCTDWRHAVLQDLARLRPDVIVMGGVASERFTPEDWVEGSTRVLKQLSPAAGTILLLPGTPRLGFDGPGCVARHRAPDGTMPAGVCETDGALAEVAPVTRHLATAAGRFANVHLLDLNDLVCPGGRCSAVSADGVVVFRDGQHLTDRFVRSLIPAARPRFEQQVPALGRP